MRHGNRNNALSRTTSHRKSMLSNMACSLIEHKRITTTVAKAKVLRKFVEPLITKSKMDSTHSRRMVFSTLKRKEAVTELFRDVAPKVGDRDGGYTRIIRLGTRLGDAAEMCMIELVDFNELLLQDAKAKTKRSRRGSKKKAADVTPEAKATQAAEAKVEEVKAEAAEDVAEATTEKSADTEVAEPTKEDTNTDDAATNDADEPKKD